MKLQTTDKQHLLYWLPLLLLLPALLLELGTMPLLADEPTRALVSLEMNISDNYVVPTINGKFYYNKPPLYNWMLAALFQLSGSESEWIVRTPVILSILIFGFLTYAIFRRHFSFQVAFFTTFSVITCGRILFYDSFLGLMDVLFSSIIFLNFYVVYYFGEKKQYYRLFLLSYLLISISYMLKGLPGIAFQAITLFVYFTFIQKEFKRLIGWYHILGFLVFLIIPTAYYLAYMEYNSLDTLFTTIVKESTKRTAFENKAVRSLLHLVSFPFQFFVDFAPWTLLLLLFLKRVNRNLVLSNPFARYLLFCVGGNILIYWISPDTIARYLFMFLPLVFGICFYVLLDIGNERYKRLFEKTVITISILIGVGYLAFPFIVWQFLDLSLLLRYSIALTLLSYGLWLLFRNSAYIIVSFISLLLIVRIGFNIMIIPIRVKTEPQSVYKQYGTEIGKLTQGAPLFLYKYAPVNHDISFYISRVRRDILGISFKPVQKGTFYITDIYDNELTRKNSIVVYNFSTSFENKKLFIVKIIE